MSDNPSGIVPDLLQTLVAGAREQARRRASLTTVASLRRAIAERPEPRDVLAALKGPGVAIIAEVKRASPSRGRLAEIADPVELALAYEAGGASMVSVLTEEDAFLGDISDLASVATAVQIPVLRKDFISDSYQVLEARAIGADAILLMASVLDDADLERLFGEALELGMTPLVEVISEHEVERAMRLGPALIGVNSRDLSTMEISSERFARLVRVIPEGPVKVAESGVDRPAQIHEFGALGADAVLVGSSLVTSSDPLSSVRLLARAGQETSRSAPSN